VLVNTPPTTPTTVTLPLASSMAPEAFSVGVLIKDFRGSASTGAITVAFTSSEKCDGDSTITIGNDYGWVIVSPKPGGGAWYRS
jgi:hypothetical protein